MAEIPHEPLLTSPYQQTVVNMGASPQGGRSSRAYKVAGITLLAVVLIVGQAVIAYFVLSQNKDLKSLQQENRDRQTQMTKGSSASWPKRMQLPMNSVPLLMDDTTNQEFSADASAPPRRSKCQKEATGEKANGLPDFRPACDENGLYQPQQCWMEACWCVNPITGEMIDTSMQSGPAQCIELLSAESNTLQRPTPLQLDDQLDIN